MCLFGLEGAKPVYATRKERKKAKEPLTNLHNCIAANLVMALGLDREIGGGRKLLNG